MSNEAVSKKAPNILLVSIYRDLVDDVSAAGESEKGELTIGSHKVGLDVFVGDPSQEAAFKDQVARASAVIILVRFLDVLSLDKIRNIYHYLAQADITIPKAVFYLRDKGELDFKISCPSCGQKLWLRDTDVGKRGRCPNCSKPFVILSQSDHLKTQLLLPQGSLCLKVIRRDSDSFRSAVGKLLEMMTSGISPADTQISLEALKHSTVRIQVQEP